MSTHECSDATSEGCVQRKVSNLPIMMQNMFDQQLCGWPVWHRCSLPPKSKMSSFFCDNGISINLGGDKSQEHSLGPLKFSPRALIKWSYPLALPLHCRWSELRLWGCKWWQTLATPPRRSPLLSRSRSCYRTSYTCKRNKNAIYQFSDNTQTNRGFFHLDNLLHSGQNAQLTCVISK